MESYEPGFSSVVDDHLDRGELVVLHLRRDAADPVRNTHISIDADLRLRQLYMHIYMYVCMYVCMHVCKFLCVYYVNMILEQQIDTL